MHLAEQIAGEFPLRDDLVYLNHAAVAPWPRRTADAVARFANENATQGAYDYPTWLEHEARLRRQLQHLLNAPSVDDIALVKNTSEALSMVAHGLPWAPGDVVVSAAEEFPSNRIVWESLAPHGVTLRTVDLQAAADPEAALIAALDGPVRLLAISSVQYGTGLRLDLERLGRACRERGVLFCVDAIQSLGALPMDVQAVQADFAMADAHKWLLGPEGIAVFYVAAAQRERLALHEYGWHMREDYLDFDALNWRPARSARRFECGSPNMLGIHAFSASLSLLSEIGLDTVSENVLRNASYLLEAIAAIQGFELITRAERGRHAGIVTFRHVHVPAASLHRALSTAGVVCALRGGGVRFSPHFYTRTQQLERAVAALEQAAANP
ncbi:aminotransferase class V-fold PLP-dependent enzyme [Ectothiorhodospiraceae bacterium 2226]|nr:aminotransferase class V-fold PLP-dependent enzyme [Ectothiorhodospiraceae bacterium 2226]